MSEYMGCHMYDDNLEEITKPATDVFEINDFTAASDWENFINDIENILRNWKLSSTNRNAKPLEKGDFSRHNWKCKSESLSFHDFGFTVTHYQLNLTPLDDSSDDDTVNLSDSFSQTDPDPGANSDLLNSSNDFFAKGPAAARLFGLREVVTLTPAGREVLGSDTRAKMVVGGVNIALYNTGCQVPVLVQVSCTREVSSHNCLKQHVCPSDPSADHSCCDSTLELPIQSCRVWERYWINPPSWNVIELTPLVGALVTRALPGLNGLALSCLRLVCLHFASLEILFRATRCRI